MASISKKQARFMAMIPHDPDKRAEASCARRGSRNEL
jgi:hypothetical protein